MPDEAIDTFFCFVRRFFDVRLAAHVSFARHGRALAGESPEHAQVVGNV